MIQFCIHAFRIHNSCLFLETIEGAVAGVGPIARTQTFKTDDYEVSMRVNKYFKNITKVSYYVIMIYSFEIFVLFWIIILVCDVGNCHGHSKK